MSILRLIASDGYVIVNKRLIMELGLNEALFIGYLSSIYTYWEDRNGLDDDGYFFATVENIEENTGMKEKRQRTTIQNLESIGLLDVKLKGCPPKRHFRVNEYLLENMLCRSPRSCEIKSCEMTEFNPAKPPTNNNKYNNIVSNIKHNKSIKYENLYINNNSIKDEKENNSFILETFQSSTASNPAEMPPEKDDYSNFENTSKKEKRISPRQIIELYNSICKSYPVVKSLSASREKTIRARQNQYNDDQFRELFEKAEESQFMKGKNKRDWIATFDWMMKDANFAKVLDGNYDNKPDQNGNSQNTTQNPYATDWPDDFK